MKAKNYYREFDWGVRLKYICKYFEGNIKDFGTCNYMGQHHHRTASTPIVSRHPLYKDVEDLLNKNYNGFSHVFKSGFEANMTASTLIDRDATVFIDKHLHQTYKIGLNNQRLKYKELPLNDISELKTALNITKDKPIYYVCDGVYSMDGVCCPYYELKELLHKHENFYLFIDEAHSIGLTGKNGVGNASHIIGSHKRLVLTASLHKAVGRDGGVIIVFDELMTKHIKFSYFNTFTAGLSIQSLEALYERLQEMSSFAGNRERTLFKESKRKLVEGIDKIGIKYVTEQNPDYLSPMVMIPFTSLAEILSLGMLVKKKGINIMFVSYPAIKKGLYCLRIAAQVQQTDEERKELFDCLKLFVKYQKAKSLFGIKYGGQ